MNTINIIMALIIVGGVGLVIYLLRGRIVRWLKVLQYKMKIRGLRAAIKDADKDKEETGRKNMVIYNTSSGEFEPVSKQFLKFKAAKGKNTNNAAMTPGRKWAQRQRKETGRKLDYSTVKRVEKKSPYVTN